LVEALLGLLSSSFELVLVEVLLGLLSSSLDLVRLAALLVPRPGVAPTHAFGWASVGVDGHGARPPEKQADGEEECCSLRRQLAQEQRRGLYQSLDTQVPNWREIDNSPEWRQWLAQPHELSGRTRQEWLNDAMAKGDAHRVASFFRGFLQASAAPHRTAVEGQQRQATGGQRIYSRADITRASEDYRRGRYTEEQYRRLSEDIVAAGREGRIVGIGPPKGKAPYG
jgi:hypothetical protein